ncbi:MAG TPA: N-acetyltransferase [Anaerolineaceae bacterium]|nr:N-acetyltransferase [Anaerolineaceae bacterium]
MDTTLTLQIPSHLREYTFRPAELEDAPGLHALYVAIDRQEGTTLAGSLEEVQRDFEDPNSAPTTENSLVAVSANGEIAAVGWIFMPGRAEQQHCALLWGGVQPKYRRQGLGKLVMGWSMQRASQRLAEFHDDLPRVLRVNCIDTAADRIAMLQENGFTPVRYYLKMHRDLSEPLPEVELPQGFHLVEWAPELDRQAYEAINSAFRDHWGWEPTSPESWQQYVTKSEGFRAARSFLAFAGEQIAGACINAVHEDDNRRLGVREGWIHNLGVLREQRGRGLGKALLLHSMRAFKAQDLQVACLMVDSENLTGALGIYERIGFQTITRNVAWERRPVIEGW